MGMAENERMLKACHRRRWLICWREVMGRAVNSLLGIRRSTARKS